MAFILGEAIANEFSNIANVLRAPVIPGTLDTSQFPASVSPSAAPVTTPSLFPPPPVGTSKGVVPPVLSTVVEVPPINTFPTPTVTPASAPCPLLSPTDFMQLVSIQNRANQQAFETGTFQITPASVSEFGFKGEFNGTPVEFDDFFRFRAFGNAGAIPVSFFGRIVRPDSTIVPFNYTLTTDNANTVFTIMPATGPGLLLGASASPPIGAISGGTVNAVGEIGRIVNGTFAPHTLLFTGQLSDTRPLSNTLATPATPQTFQQYGEVVTTDPVGLVQTVTITPPSGRQVRPNFVLAHFTNSAAVGTRAFAVKYAVGGTQAWRAAPAVFMVASQFGVVAAWVTGAGQSITNSSTTVSQGAFLMLPADLWFSTAVVVSVLYDGGFAGDQISGLTVDFAIQ